MTVMNKNHILHYRRKGGAAPLLASACAMLITATSCMAPKGSGMGGEVTGVGGVAFAEPTPHGMVLVDRGAYAMGPVTEDSLRGIKANPRGVSIDSFWMDETEVTNSKYKQFVFWVRDSNEDEQRAIESVYRTNPITGRRELDPTQLNYRYEIYNHTAAAKRRNRLDPATREYNTDIPVNEELPIISKDTAYFTDEGS